MINAVSSSTPLLRVYPQQSRDPQTGQLISEQLPYLKNLRQKIESITGWQVGYAESTHSCRARKTKSKTTVLGALAIEDMSFDRPHGQKTASRSEVESLVQSLDQMLRVIQDDRSAREDFSTTVSRVVHQPLNQWMLRGVCGCQLGDVVSWSIGAQGHVYVLAAEFDGQSDVELSSVSRNLQSVFRAGVAAGLPFGSLQTMLEFNLADTADDVELLGMTVIEFAPDEGHYQVHQVGHHHHAVLLDMEAGSVQPLDPEATGNCVHSHQLIVLGDPQGDSVSHWLDDSSNPDRTFEKAVGQLDSLPLVAPCVGIFRA
jgi:phage baseplate assembly protein W